MKRRLPLGLPYGATLLGLLFVFLSVGPFVIVFDPGSTWWPWEPLRAWVALVAAVAVLAWSRRAAVVAVVAWALVAAPLVPAPSSRGLSPQVPGTVIGTSTPDAGPPSGVGRPPGGFHALRAGPVPVGATKLTRASKAYLNGEFGYARNDLVAWSLVLLPWPHVDRTNIGTLDGSANKDWYPPVTLAREGDALLVAGQKRTSYDDYGAPFEVKEFGWSLSGSGLTYFGWLLVALALLVRLLRARHSDAVRPPMGMG